MPKTLSSFAVVVLGVLAAAGPARAQPAGAPKPDPSGVAKKADKPDRDSYRPRISGFIQTFYRYAFETGEDGVVDNDNFRVMRARLKFKGRLSRKVRYVVEVDPRAPAIGGVMRDAYISLRLIPRHEIRLGQQKTQFGFENRVSSSRLYAVNRSELSDALARGLTLRDVGLGLVGRWPVNSRLRVEDAFNLVNGNGMNTQDDDTDKMSVWARVGARYKAPSFKTWLGISGGYGDFMEEGDLELDPSDDFRLEFKRVGTDLRFENAWLFVSAEFAYGTDTEPADPMEPGSGGAETVYGYYVNLVGKTPWRVGPVARVDTFLDEFRRWTFGAYYGLSDERLRIIVNYEYREIFDDVRGDDKFYVWVQTRF